MTYEEDLARYKAMGMPEIRWCYDSSDQRMSYCDVDEVREVLVRFITEIERLRAEVERLRGELSEGFTGDFWQGFEEGKREQAEMRALAETYRNKAEQERDRLAAELAAMTKEREASRLSLVTYIQSMDERDAAYHRLVCLQTRRPIYRPDRQGD